MHASKSNPHHAASQWCAAAVGGKWRVNYAVPREAQPADGLIERQGKVPENPQSFSTVHSFEQGQGGCVAIVEVVLIFNKAFRVLGHAEFIEPVRNLLHGGHRDPVGT
jgi:hypothetical protein